MIARVPTPEQAAAIMASGRDVLVEAGAGSGKTGVMVDRYCRLVCDEQVASEAVLAFTFTDKAAAELRLRIRPSSPGGQRRAPSGPASCWGDRRCLGDHDPRLLQPVAGGIPGGRRHRPTLSHSRWARGPQGRPRRLRRSPREIPGPGRQQLREDGRGVRDHRDPRDGDWGLRGAAQSRHGDSAAPQAPAWTPRARCGGRPRWHPPRSRSSSPSPRTGSLSNGPSRSWGWEARSDPR